MPKQKGISAVAVVLAFAMLAPASALAKPGGTNRPVKGTTSGAVTITLAAGLPTKIEATGVMAHLGRYAGRLEGNAVIVAGTGFGHGSFTLVAANGDEVTGTFTFSGPFPSPGPHEVNTSFTITGGTGRFADASGTIIGSLLATPSCFNLPACPGALVETVAGPLSGRITY